MPLDIDIGDGADALTINQLRDALDGTYWTSGWGATPGSSGLKVDIAPGTGSVDGTGVSTGATETVDFTGDPDPDDPRKAVIYVDGAGAVQKVLGPATPATPSDELRFRTWNPAPPADPPGVVVAEVWLPADASSLTTDDIRDRRIPNEPAATAASAPFTDRNSARTFTESPLDITHTDTRSINESLQLVSELGSTTTRAEDTSSNSPSEKRGIEINPNVDLEGVEATVSTNTAGLSTVQLLDDSKNVLVEDTSVSGAGDVARLEHALSADTTYYIVGYNSSGYTSGANYSASNPYTATDIDITAGYIAGSADQGSAHVITDVTSIYTLSTPPTTGSSILEWPMPRDLHEWDAVTFTKVSDGGSVDIYIEEYQSGNWTEISGPVSRGASIPAASGNNVRFRVEFSRPSTSEKPRLLSLHARWEL